MTPIIAFIKLMKENMYINRDIEKKILEAANQFASITVYGARQVGKSTLLEKVFPSFPRVSLDDKELRAYALDDPKGFLSYYRPPVIIDEIQKAPELLEYIKMEIDRRKSEWLKANEHSHLLYVLTGSNQLDLKKAVTESLAGRTCVFHLSSFSYNEIEQRGSFSFFDPSIDSLRAKEALMQGERRSRKKIFEDIFKGGMPDYIANSLDRDMFFRSYIDTYLEKDVNDLIGPGKELSFRSFMKCLALRTSCPLNYEEISRNIGIDQRTVKSWVSILVSSGIVRLLQPYARNASDRVIKTSKVYFMDTGLCAFLCALPSADILEHSAFAGAFYENYVVSEVIKSYWNSYKNDEDIYYYRDKEQREADLVIESFDSVYPIEIKKGVNPANSSKRFRMLSGLNKIIRPGLVIASVDKISPINEEVFYCPVDMIGL